MLKAEPFKLGQLYRLNTAGNFYNYYCINTAIKIAGIKNDDLFLFLNEIINFKQYVRGISKYDIDTLIYAYRF